MTKSPSFRFARLFTIVLISGCGSIYANAVAPMPAANSHPGQHFSYMTEISVNYPQFGGYADTSAQAQLNQALRDKARSFLSPCVESNSEKDAADLQAASFLGGKDKKICSYTSTVKLMSDSIASVQFNQYYHSPGEQGAARTYRKGLTYSLSQNKMISFSDLFRNDSDYLTRIASIVKEKVSKGPAKSYLLPDLKNGMAPKLENFSNFTLSRTALVIYLQPLQVAADVAGVIDVHIPYKEICPVLNDEFAKLGHCK